MSADWTPFLVIVGASLAGFVVGALWGATQGIKHATEIILRRLPKYLADEVKEHFTNSEVS